MKAVQIDAYGGSERLVYRDAPAPAPGPGEVLVAVELAGVNFIDVYLREGRYRNSATYGAAPPFTLGMEGLGTVLDANGAEGLDRGQRVAWCLARGSYAEQAAVPAWKLVPVPEDLAAETALTLMLQGLTAHYLSHSLYPLAAGDWCLVHAAAGGVGQLLVQLAKRRGARVIATVGSPAKAETAARCGADHVVLYREADFPAAVRALTGSAGVHVVYDSVGKDTIEGSIACLRRRGTCVNYGGSSGMVESVSPLRLAEAGSVFFTRPHLAHYLADAAEIRGRASELFAAVREGALQVHVDRCLPLAEAGAAHQALEARATRGKLVLATRGVSTLI